MPLAAEIPSPAVWAAESLVGAWKDAIRRTVPGHGGVSVLFSGGLDSSLLAFSARDRNPGLELVTVGVGDAPDLRAAADAARILGLSWRGHRLANLDMARVRSSWAGELDGLREPARSVAVACALAIERANEPRVLCGQGADELFFGYAHFGPLSDAERAVRAKEDMDRLDREDWPRARRFAARLGRSLASPYLEAGFRAAALALPVDAHRDGTGIRKPVLRALARRVGLPELLASRPKRAMQYGSRVHRALSAASGPFTFDRSGGGPGSRRRLAARARATGDP